MASIYKTPRLDPTRTDSRMMYFGPNKLRGARYSWGYNSVGEFVCKRDGGWDGVPRDDFYRLPNKTEKLWIVYGQIVNQLMERLGPCQTSLVDDLLNEEKFSREYISNYGPGGDDIPEIYQWFWVDDGFANELNGVLECVLDNEYGKWWGRQACGQSIDLDPTFWEIAKLRVKQNPFLLEI